MGFVIYIPHLRILPNKSYAFFFFLLSNWIASSVLAAVLQKFQLVGVISIWRGGCNKVPRVSAPAEPTYYISTVSCVIH